MSDPPKGPRLTVVVVTYNSAALLPGLLASLPAGMACTEWELVVADNDSSDDVEAVLAGTRTGPFSVQLLRLGTNGGYAAGINAGVAAAHDHDAVLVLNPDVRLEAGCARALYDELVRSGAGIAVPRLADRRGDLILSIRREPSLLRAWSDVLLGAERAGRMGTLGEVVSDPDAYERGQVVEWAEGSTVMVSAECWRRCGPWDESFFLYSEETEFALRARDLGMATIYVPTGRAVHLEGESGVSPRLWPLVVANRLRLYRRRHGVVASAVFWAALVAREVSRAVLGRRPSRRAVATLLNPARLRAPRGPEFLG